MKYKLLGIIKYHNDTSEDLMKYLNISSSSFYNKINKKFDFTRGEIQKIKERYNLTAEQIDDIFFNE